MTKNPYDVIEDIDSEHNSMIWFLERRRNHMQRAHWELIRDRFDSHFNKRKNQIRLSYGT